MQAHFPGFIIWSHFTHYAKTRLVDHGIRSPLPDVCILQSVKASARSHTYHQLFFVFGQSCRLIQEAPESGQMPLALKCALHSRTAIEQNLPKCDSLFCIHRAPNDIAGSP